MKELKFEKKKLKLELDGAEYIITYPSYFQLKAFAKQVTEIGDELAVSNLFESLGMPKEVLMVLDVEQVNEILETIAPETKKK